MKNASNKIIKQLFTVLAILIASMATAQVPPGINYQAVLRNPSGTIMQNQNATVKFTIHQATTNGTIMYEETQTTTTNNFGLVNLQIGQGAPVTGTFSLIQWGTNSYYLQVWADIGTGYVNLGTTQFISVPYAMVADTVLHGGGNSYTGGTGINVAGTVITNTAPNQIVALTGTGATTITGTYPNFTINSTSGIIILNSSNYSSASISNDNVVNIQGTITLSANYNNLNVQRTFISGGTINGSSSQTISFGSFSVISGVNFSSLAIDGGINVQFVNCHFNNVTQLPSSCILSGCQITSSTFTPTNSISYVNSSTIDGCSIPRIEKITNTYIFNASTLGNASYSVFQISNCQVDGSTIYMSGTFSGNTCNDSQISVNPDNKCVITGNAFQITTLGTVIDIDVTSGSNPLAVNVNDNNFLGNQNFPSTQYINVHGTYTNTRFIIKICNNTAIGGSTAPLVSSTYNGQADLMVNDNDLEYTGGLGVSQGAVTGGGYIYVRDNQIH